MFAAKAHNDWDTTYAYNGARHSGARFRSNELMMGRKIRAPNELLRASCVT